MSAAPVSTGLNARRSVTCIWQPPHGLLRVLLEGGLEHRRPEEGARQPQRVHLAREALGLDARRADQLERPRGAAPFREQRAFEQHRARIDDGGVERRHVRRRHHPRQRRSSSANISRRQPSISTTSSSAPRPNCLVEQARQLADRHAVTHRDRELADERFEAGRERRALDVHAVDRVGPVAHDHRHAVARARAQAVGHRVDVGVDARADVLQVDDEHVEAAQHVRGRLARLAVERVDRHAPRRGRRRAASRSCCPARRSGSRAAGRRSRRASRRRPRPGDRRCARSRGRPTRDCRRCPRALPRSRGDASSRSVPSRTEAVITDDMAPFYAPPARIAGVPASMPFARTSSDAVFRPIGSHGCRARGDGIVRPVPAAGDVPGAARRPRRPRGFDRSRCRRN